MFTLYTTPLSANGRKVLAVVHHLGLYPEVKLVNVYAGEGRTPEYLSIQPAGQIPALRDGDLTLWESNAILQYLSEEYGDHRLSSRDPRRRADIARWMFWEASQWQPALTPVLAAFVGRLILPQLAAAAAAPARWSEPRFQALAGQLDAHLRGRAFLVGEELTLADFSVAGMMTYARRAEFPFATFANVGAWYARVEALPGWKASAVAPWG